MIAAAALNRLCVVVAGTCVLFGLTIAIGAAAQTNQALIEELADVLDVMQALADLHGFTMQDVLNVQQTKRNQRGGFEGRKFVTVAQHQVGSYGEKYCLADAEKYSYTYLFSLGVLVE